MRPRIKLSEQTEILVEAVNSGKLHDPEIIKLGIPGKIASSTENVTVVQNNVTVIHRVDNYSENTDKHTEQEILSHVSEPAVPLLHFKRTTVTLAIKQQIIEEAKKLPYRIVAKKYGVSAMYISRLINKK